MINMRSAILDSNNVVIAVHIVDSLDGLLDGTNANIGDTWDGTQFVKPVIPETVPRSITRRQFKLALLGIDLLDDVETAIAASTDRALQISYNDALDFERNNPLVLAMSAMLGKTEAELDALFIAGSKL